MKNYKIGLLVSIIILLMFLIRPIMFFDQQEMGNAQIIEGVLESSKLSLNDRIYEIKGEVKAYEKQLITTGSDTTESFQWRVFPNPWKSDEGVSYASELFKITGLEPGEDYAFYLLDALTAYRFFVDGQLIGQVGTVSDHKENAIPSAKTQAVFFTAQGHDAEVVIQMSNYEANLTGVWQKTIFGKRDQITGYEWRVNVGDAFIIGAILFLSIYMWILYFILRNDKAILYFAISCGLVTVKVLLSGQQIGFETYTFLPYNVGIRIAYLTIPGILVSFLAFVRCYFKSVSSSLFFKVSLFLSGIEMLILLFTSQKFYMNTFMWYQLFILLTSIVTIYWVVKACMQGVEGALLYLAGFAVFLGFVINDILYSQLLIDTGYYLGFGLLILLMTQASMIAIRFLNLLKTEEFMKKNLENLVVERTRELEAERNRFENLSKVDALTHLFNRGYLSEILNFEFEGFKRYKSMVSILMLDLDHFKHVNDTYGHIVGDEVLKRVADELKQKSRRSDFVGRFGGEEFLIILRFTGIEDARIHAEHLRVSIEKLKFKSPQGEFSITTSIGVADANLTMVDETDMIRQADEALYKAKSTGRNRVC